MGAQAPATGRRLVDGSRIGPFIRGHRRQVLITLTVAFGVVFSLISLVNHYVFRTDAMDLGLYNNAVYDYAHFRWNDNPIKLYDNLLSDHFTLLQALVSPLSWIFGSYTLVVVQIAAVLFGGYGAYRYNRLRSGDEALALILLFQFWSMWGIYSALAYDYHDNVVAAMLVPWLFYYFHLKRWLPVALFYVLILVSKENMALWLVFLAIGLAVLYFRDKMQVKVALTCSVVAALYFAVIVKSVMPALAGVNREYTYIQDYAALGAGFAEIIKTCLTRPLYALGLLFGNHLHVERADYIKAELHAMVLLSGGVALLRRPVYLVMLVPVYAWKLFSNTFSTWGINYQYSIEFVPVLSIAIAELVAKLEHRRRIWVAAGFGLVTVLATAGTFEHRVSQWYAKADAGIFTRPALQFYRAAHYRRPFDVDKAYRALELIPKDASVSATSQLVPHLAFRDYIYVFPYVGDASYLALGRNSVPWLTDEAFEGRIEEYRRSPDWEAIYEQGGVLVLRRIKPAAQRERGSFER